ncbi:acyl-CoA dehydrogenase family protein [Saccharopolyspora oryzae]|uniref:Acyl-CoA dehydrogenase family protein n=1 Tax=Saccharopolyspora oryzae TaxID=2997343 RepID=A0ABT4V4W2_9PSEU|nr:acyl-CoA dehydrogenase family protein [Saccharopolyspora oryzae]MDA3628863.1 acyl-CoA dehydrogenase family protein [Saccharopolyspora oryzae]
MDFELTDTQTAFKEMAAQFVDAEIVPHVREWDRREEVDLAIVRKLGELGFLGLTLPEEYGGVEADMVSYALVIEELGRGDSSVRGIVSVSLGLVSKSIASYGTEEQKQRWLPMLSSGEGLGCFALTEPDAGSDPGSLTTRARRDGGDWVITGQKMFITNGTWAKVALLFARTSDDGGRGITAFLVPTDSPGFTANTVHGKLGLRGQATAELVLDEVRVPDSARLGEVGKGLGIALGALTKGRISVAAGAVGVAQAALSAATRYAGERVQFGKPIASRQLVQELLADSAVEVEAARLLTLRAASMAERGVSREALTKASSMAKLHASETAVKVANNALQVFGGYGFIDEYPVGKYLRDARVLTLYEGTSQVQKLIIGRSLTGVDALT